MHDFSERLTIIIEESCGICHSAQDCLQVFDTLPMIQGLHAGGVICPDDDVIQGQSHQIQVDLEDWRNISRAAPPLINVATDFACLSVSSKAVAEGLEMCNPTSLGRRQVLPRPATSCRATLCATKSSFCGG